MVVVKGAQRWWWMVFCCSGVGFAFFSNSDIKLGHFSYIENVLNLFLSVANPHYLNESKLRKDKFWPASFSSPPLS